MKAHPKHGWKENKANWCYTWRNTEKCVDSYISMLAKKRINSLERERFPDQLKLDDFTKKFEWNKENHQPVSALSYTYKIFFRILFWYP